MYGLKKWDLLNIGSIGFAQVGQHDFNKKLEIEMTILFKYVNSNFPVPKELSELCRFKAARFEHDFGAYREICLYYNRDTIDNYEEENPKLHDMFWEFANKAECAFSSDEIETTLTNLCNLEYRKDISFQVIRNNSKDSSDKENHTPSLRSLIDTIEEIKKDLKIV